MQPILINIITDVILSVAYFSTHQSFNESYYFEMKCIFMKLIKMKFCVKIAKILHHYSTILTNFLDLNRQYHPELSLPCSFNLILSGVRQPCHQSIYN
ncbi:hypothetical protein BLOT_012123 [Blomia tropicalis]|nr:hypothetical protein BLOT_012123 [Blomia tropicalis]